jgi:CRP-like cAMP-binding protein
MRALAAHTDIVRVPAGHVLAQAGSRARQYLTIVDGEAATEGARRVGPGAGIGGRELVDGTAFDRSVVATTDCTIVVVTAPAMRWALQEIDGLADRLRAA